MGHEKVDRLPFCTRTCYSINFCIYAMLRTRANFSWPTLYLRHIQMLTLTSWQVTFLRRFRRLSHHHFIVNTPPTFRMRLADKVITSHAWQMTVYSGMCDLEHLNSDVFLVTSSLVVTVSLNTPNFSGSLLSTLSPIRISASCFFFCVMIL